MHGAICSIVYQLWVGFTSVFRSAGFVVQAKTRLAKLRDGEGAIADSTKALAVDPKYAEASDLQGLTWGPCILRLRRFGMPGSCPLCGQPDDGSVHVWQARVRSALVCKVVPRAGAGL